MNELAQQQPSSFFRIQERDILAELLADKRSPETRRAYARNLKYFFASITDQPLSPPLVSEFLRLERFTAIGLVLNYKSKLIEQGLAENTINQRLASIKSLVKFAGDIGKCEWSLEAISGEKVKSYRDTSGIDRTAYAKLLEGCDRTTLKGARDYAIFRLLWDNALRRGEISKTNCGDFDLESGRLRILGKGKGTQMESIDLSTKTTEAIAAWVLARSIIPSPDTPLFISLDRATKGHRLSGSSIYTLVRETAERVGIAKRLSPHRCRHSSITAAAQLTNGDIRKVQKLSRHAKVETVMTYIDNLAGVQREVSDLLADLL